MHGRVAHKIAGISALIALIALAVGLRDRLSSGCPAEVVPAHEFHLSSIAPGRYVCSLREGSSPFGSKLIEEQLLVFDRSDLVELRLEPGITTGVEVTEGQVIANLRSLHNAESLKELEALKGSLLAQRDLLKAGGRREEIDAAQQRVIAAEAARDVQSARLARIRILADKGLISPIELEVADMEDRAMQQEVEVARAEVHVAAAPARPEALARLDAEIAALDASMTEIQGLRTVETITSPISGVAEVGGAPFELRILDTKSLRLRFAAPEVFRSSIAAGDRIDFVSPAIPDQSFPAEILQVAESSSSVNGIQIFWVTALLKSNDSRLRPGLIGSVETGISFDSWWPRAQHRTEYAGGE